ncbi:MAG: hypothetical protein LBU65_16545 [Planctomycetaceae bacterium]|nr:hypothetical protein [Planctomycetaceae bacterium]
MIASIDTLKCSSHCWDILLLSATPYQGDHFRFWMFIQLLEPALGSYGSFLMLPFTFLHSIQQMPTKRFLGALPLIYPESVRKQKSPSQDGLRISGKYRYFSLPRKFGS